jgi:hypothetical protein
MTMLATISDHDPDCSGCPACSAHWARFLSMSAAEQAAYNAGRTDRALAEPVPRRVSMTTDRVQRAVAQHVERGGTIEREMSLDGILLQIQKYYACSRAMALVRLQIAVAPKPYDAALAARENKAKEADEPEIYDLSRPWDIAIAKRRARGGQ